MAVHAVTAGAVEVDEPHLFLRQAKEASNVLRLPCVPCEAVHTMAASAPTSATAQDGPIDPWLCIGQK